MCWPFNRNKRTSKASDGIVQFELSETDVREELYLQLRNALETGWKIEKDLEDERELEATLMNKEGGVHAVFAVMSDRTLGAYDIEVYLFVRDSQLETAFRQTLKSIVHERWTSTISEDLPALQVTLAGLMRMDGWNGPTGLRRKRCGLNIRSRISASEELARLVVYFEKYAVPFIKMSSTALSFVDAVSHYYPALLESRSAGRLAAFEMLALIRSKNYDELAKRRPEYVKLIESDRHKKYKEQYHILINYIWSIRSSVF